MTVFQGVLMVHRGLSRDVVTVLGERLRNSVCVCQVCGKCLHQLQKHFR